MFFCFFFFLFFCTLRCSKPMQVLIWYKLLNGNGMIFWGFLALHKALGWLVSVGFTLFGPGRWVVVAVVVMNFCYKRKKSRDEE